MVRRTNPEDDDWQNVKDAKKRKKIQDRLAQRARRQRLREAKIGSKSLVHLASTAHATKSCDCETLTELSSRTTFPDALVFSTPSGSDVTPLDPALDFLNIDLDLDLDFSMPDPNELDPPPRTHSLIPLPLPSPSQQLSPPLSVFSALYLNGQILGLSCSIYITSRSPWPSPSHPLPLYPTEMQLQLIHPRWFDRLPFPKMRDNLIKLQGVLDEEELLKDFFTMPTWTIETGGRRGGGWESAAWDVSAWKMEECWKVKWGWLMY